jgi:hypothetical protein
MSRDGALQAYVDLVWFTNKVDDTTTNVLTFIKNVQIANFVRYIDHAYDYDFYEHEPCWYTRWI